MQEENFKDTLQKGESPKTGSCARSLKQFSFQSLVSDKSTEIVTLWHTAEDCSRCVQRQQEMIGS